MKIYHLISWFIIASSTLLLGSANTAQKERRLFEEFAIQSAMPENWIDKLNELHEPPTASYINATSNLLFDYYPQLKEKIPYIQLASLPTPVEKLHTLSKEQGMNLYIKRDDLSGGIDPYGTPSYGGNKVRKLEFLLAQALARKTQRVMTFGAAGSNHALATAAHAQRLGMQPICMLKSQPNSSIVQQNLLMHLNYGSELHYSQTISARNLTAFLLWLEEYKKSGIPPYIIPTGGSNIIGTLGFVNAAFELNEQIKKGLCPKPTHIYLACGSCATTAGLLLGCKAIGLDVQIVAVAVEPDANGRMKKTIQKLFDDTNRYLHSIDLSFPICTYDQNDLKVDCSFAGQGYGVATQAGNNAETLILARENIPLECTYTAKAFSALLATAPKDHDAVILFWNTYYSPTSNKRSLNLDYHSLPACLHDYFSNP